jgi:hypothetical protein
MRWLERFLVIFMLALMSLWLWMLVVTSVYFHTWTEKVLGVALGMAFWRFSYAHYYMLFSINPTIFK